jgi:hypothetical protein
MNKLSKLINTVDYFYKLASDDENFADVKKPSKALQDEWERKLRGLNPISDNGDDDSIGDEYSGSEDEYSDPSGSDEPVYEAPEEEEIDEEEEDNFTPGMYDDIIDYATRRVEDSDITDQMLMIGELYRRAIQFSTESGRPVGYKFVYDAIDVLSKEITNRPEYQEEIEEAEESGDEDATTDSERLIEFLRSIKNDLRERAGGIAKLLVPEDAVTLNKMRDVKKNHKVFSKELLEKNFIPVGNVGAKTKNEEDNEDKTINENDQGDYGDLGVEDDDEEKLDTNLEEMEQAFKGKDEYKGNHQFEAQRDSSGRITGQHSAGREPINWKSRFSNEIADYAVQLESSNNPEEKVILNKLIALVSTISEEKEKQIDLYTKLRLQGDDKDPELVSEYDAFKIEFKKLKSNKYNLLEQLRKLNVSEELQNLNNKALSSKNDTEKFIADQLKKLYELKYMMPVTNKTAEIEARQKLIDVVMPKVTDRKDPNYGERMIGIRFNGTLPETSNGQTIVLDLLKKIEEAKNVPRQTFKERNIEEADRIRAIKTMEGKLTSFTDPGDFPSVLKRLQQHTSSILGSDKKDVIDTWRDKVIASAAAKEKELFGPYIDAVIEARKLKDNKALKSALSALFSALKASLQKFPEYAEQDAYRVAEFNRTGFPDIIAFWKELSKLCETDPKKSGKILNNIDNLTPEQKGPLKAKLTELLARGKELAARPYPNVFTGKERKSTRLLLENMVIEIQKMLNKL